MAITTDYDSFYKMYTIQRNPINRPVYYNNKQIKSPEKQLITLHSRIN